MKKLKAAIVGATGMVGQRLVSLLNDHPLFEPAVLLASRRSAGKKYEEAVRERWTLKEEIPACVRDLPLLDAAEPDALQTRVDLVFCAVNLPKEETRTLEEAYAKRDLPVISNNSANRLVPDVPMILPELNPEHLAVIPSQKKRLGTKRGFIVTKCNCSLQSYVPLLHPLRPFGIQQVAVCTYQAISGAGKTFKTMPEIQDNLIPFIPGEEEKSQEEPLKIWGRVNAGIVSNAPSPSISAQCVRVPVSDGHLAAVFVRLREKPRLEEIQSLWENFKGLPQTMRLPSAPKKLIHVFYENDRPQPRLDRDLENGMAVSAGRLRYDSVFDYKFIGLSHNTLRGAAGGAVLLAELLAEKGYLD